MLTFTTTEPYSMFGSAEGVDPKVPQREFEILNDGKAFMSVYIHGDAQHEAGFDIPLIVEGSLDVTAEHDGAECEVELPSPPDEYARPQPNRKIPCLIFTWDTGHVVTTLFNHVKRPQFMGLIVAKADRGAIEYAKEKRAKREWML